MKDLNELFLEELADIYDAEKQLIKALPKMAEQAKAPELQSAFEDHLEQTQEHIKRLEEVFELCCSITDSARFVLRQLSCQLRKFGPRSFESCSFNRPNGSAFSRNPRAENVRF